MKTIIAIGGGSFQKGETRKLDEYAIQRTQKQNPKLLFLPTASKDDQGYAKRFKQYYRSLGCEVESLRLFHTLLDTPAIRKRCLDVDIIYLGAGNLQLLLDTFLEKGMCEILKEAFEQGIVLVGMSAGASYFFEEGYSDVYDDASTFAYLPCAGFIKGVFCPHAQDKNREDFFTEDHKNLIKISCSDKDAYVYTEQESYYFSSQDEFLSNN